MNPEEKAAFSKMTRKKKLEHIFYYYKWHIIISVFVLIFLISLVHGILTAKKTVFSLAMVNSNVTPSDKPPIVTDFGSTCTDFDPGKQQMTSEFLYIDQNSMGGSALAIQQKLMTMMASGSLDVLLSPKDMTDQFALAWAFCDLRDLLSEETLNELEESGYKIYYYSYENEDNNSITDVPIGVDISSSPVIKSGFSSNSGQITPYYDNKGPGSVIYTVIIKSENKNRAVDFLKYLTAQ